MARQDPPPKCLVVFLDGVLRDGEDVLMSTHKPHLDAVARDGSCGLLAVRDPLSDSHEVCLLYIYIYIYIYIYTNTC